MFNDVDETLKQYFTAELPISPGELDVSFERPTREWSGRLSRPTLNCFMYDIRERKLFRDEPPAILPNGKGGFRRERAAPRIDLTYTEAISSIVTRGRLSLTRPDDSKA